MCIPTTAVAAGQPGGLLGEDPHRGQRAVRRRRPSSPRSCSSRASATAASSGIGRRYSGYGANGAVRMADARRPPRRGRPPTTGAPVRRPTGPAASSLGDLAVGHRRDDGAQHRVERRGGPRPRQELGRVVEELEGRHRAHARQSAYGRAELVFGCPGTARRIRSMTPRPRPRPVRRRRRPCRRRRTGQAGTGGARGEVVAALEEQTTPTPSTAPRRREEIYSIDTPPPTVSRVAARGARVLLHPHRPGRALPADARQGGLLPDGLGRQRPADRAPGAELLRGALRPVAALRPRLHPAGEAGPEAAGPGQPAELRRAVRAAGAGGREGLRVAVAHPRPLGRLGADLHDGRPRSRRPSRSARSCATSPAARPTSRRRRRCGTSRSRPRSPRPSWRPGSTPAPTTGSPSTAPRRHARCTSRRPAPS